MMSGLIASIPDLVLEPQECMRKALAAVDAELAKGLIVSRTPWVTMTNEDEDDERQIRKQGTRDTPTEC
jgi:hypothetical protein